MLGSQQGLKIISNLKIKSLKKNVSGRQAFTPIGGMVVRYPGLFGDIDAIIWLGLTDACSFIYQAKFIEINK